MGRIVYENRGTIIINGKEIPNIKSFKIPSEKGYQHEDDLQGGGVVQVVSAERKLSITYGVPKVGVDFDWSTVVDSSVEVIFSNGKCYVYGNCYIATDGEPEFGGKDAAVRTVEILVGERVIR